MTVTIGSLTFGNLTAQPFGYEATNAKAGLSARQWSVQGLLTPSEWLSLVNEYNSWRDSRIQDEDTVISLVVGTTINFSGTGPGGVTWSSVPCWFSVPPTAEQNGIYLAASFTVVDAAQALQVIIKTKEDEEIATGGGGAGGPDLPDLGTYNLGGVTVTLTKPIDSYQEGPQLNLTTLGYHYVSGPKVVQKTKNIEGYFDSTSSPSGVSTINSWYESQILATPGSGTYFPISPPNFSAEKTLVDGASITRYTVSIVLALVI